MPIHRDDDWLQIAELDDQDQIRFTPEFQAMMGDLGWGAKLVSLRLPRRLLLEYKLTEAAQVGS
jgi:hypothetical protein